MTIYIDGQYRCHIADDGTRRGIETAFFDGKCPEYIEGYRYVPAGECWVRSDGERFNGEMVSPAEDSATLEALQREYEHAQYLDAMAALEAIYGGET